MINVKGHMRNVVISKRDSLTITGRVGTVSFAWNKKYPLPAINIKGSWTIGDPNTQRWVKLFIEAYEAAMIAPKGISPMHFEESNKEVVVTKSIAVKKVQHVSGVPLWMKEEHKMWVKCNKKDGASYYRRTRFKEDSRDLVEEYLPVCSNCPNRDICDKPCILDMEIA
jgi:hypothetical protein